MKHNTRFKDPYAQPTYEPSTPELGKDWPPPEETPSEKPQEPASRQASSPNDLLYERQRPEMVEEDREEPIGGTRRLQSDLRYTSVMRKQKDMGKNEAEKKVESISNRADNVLMRINSVFPFDLFPNTVTIDANKVTIVDKMFFASETVTSILLEEITDVVVQSNFFLGRLVITYSHHPLRPKVYAVASLKKTEALRAAEIIQGLLVLRISEGIDISKLKPEEIIKQLGNIGRAHEHLPSL